MEGLEGAGGDAGGFDGLEGADVAGLVTGAVGLEEVGAAGLGFAAGAGADAFLPPPDAAWRTVRLPELLPPPPV